MQRLGLQECEDRSVHLRPLRLYHVEDKGRRAVPVIVHYPEHRVRAKTLGPRGRGDGTVGEGLGWPSIAFPNFTELQDSVPKRLKGLSRRQIRNTAFLGQRRGR